MTDTCEMRELAPNELDVVFGGFLDFNNSFNTLLQGNLQIAVVIGGRGFVTQLGGIVGAIGHI